MGLLGMACSDGTVRVLCVLHPKKDNLSKGKNQKSITLVITYVILYRGFAQCGNTYVRTILQNLLVSCWTAWYGEKQKKC